MVMPMPLLQNVDCFGVQVPDIDQALAFYRNGLRQRLLWRTLTSGGLAFADAASVPALVLHTKFWPIVSAIKVASVTEAIREAVRPWMHARRFRNASGQRSGSSWSRHGPPAEHRRLDHPGYQPGRHDLVARSEPVQHMRNWAR